MSQQEWEKKAERNWLFWRPVLETGGISYSEAFAMDMDELNEANAAVTIWQRLKAKRGDF
ncbi:hypothetical protein ERY13_27055 [Paenibacillus mucilaginosus]|nr:hypothetical protein ERY13_27055 [Paenibacillus mucilaginosus]